MSNNDITRFVHNCALFPAHPRDRLGNIRNNLRKPHIIRQGENQNAGFVAVAVEHVQIITFTQ